MRFLSTSNSTEDNTASHNRQIILVQIHLGRTPKSGLTLISA
jgi:hypothetical protein